jgi:Protein of unknown function (DUF1176)
MSLRFSLLPVLALASVSSAQGLKLGEQKTYGDWTVACDNIVSCQAVALQPEDNFENGLSIVVSRDAETDDLAVSLAGTQTDSDRYRILIDGRMVDSGTLVDKKDAMADVTGPDALKLIRAIARGNQLIMDDGKGGLLGKTSLAGSRAALRHIDTAQNRVGTASALVAIGRRKLKATPASQPVITARRIGSGGAVPDASAIVSLVESSGCTNDRYETSEDSAQSLGQSDGKARALILVNCGAGAYNITSAPYVGTQGSDGKWAFAPARFDHVPWEMNDNGVLPLVNATWDPATQQLSSYAKARGIGDCGSSHAYVWDGAKFRLVEADSMTECRGSLDWIRIWTAAVKFTD